MVTTVPPAETRTLLKNISWQTFKAMLADMGNERNSRLAYDNGRVEIMTPLMPHENSNRLIEGFILVLCEEFGLEVKTTGSLTLTREDLEKGGEPDSSYYIQNELLVRDKEKIDFNQAPPPDLVLEVDYSKPKIVKLSLYASMGIPEFWRYKGTILRIYTLLDNQKGRSRSYSYFCTSCDQRNSAIYPRKQKNWSTSSQKSFSHLGKTENIAKCQELSIG